MVTNQTGNMTQAQPRKAVEEKLANGYRQTEICYKGFAYNVRSQWGVDSLRRAIERDGNG
jgi:hypothetical protein